VACKTDICLKAVHCLIPDHLIKSCGKQIERGEDAPIGAQAILLHDILIVYLQHGQHFEACQGWYTGVKAVLQQQMMAWHGVSCYTPCLGYLCLHRMGLESLLDLS